MTRVVPVENTKLARFTVCEKTVDLMNHKQTLKCGPKLFMLMRLKFVKVKLQSAGSEFKLKEQCHRMRTCSALISICLGIIEKTVRNNMLERKPSSATDLVSNNRNGCDIERS